MTVCPTTVRGLAAIGVIAGLLFPRPVEAAQTPAGPLLAAQQLAESPVDDPAAAPSEHHGLAALHGDGPGMPGDQVEAEHASGEHAPSFSDINWYYGMLGEREGVEPGLVYRPVGMPVPLVALFLNSAIVFGLLYFAMRAPVASGLKKRKAAIMQGMDDASRMKSEAEGQLADYEQRLTSIDEAIAAVRRDMRDTAEAERRRVLAEAVERRSRLERDARRLVEQERHAAREQLQREAVRAAVAAAARQLESQISSGDQEQLIEEYLRGLAGRASVSLGGGA